ncbi:MAG: peptidoglycan-binding protein, partial [Candidatus Dadabacteria bacterium]
MNIGEGFDLYLRHFGLHTDPFALTPDPAFLYLSAGHAEALAALKLGLHEKRGLVAMIGEVGTGKTTLLYTLLSSLGPNVRTAYIANTTLSFDGILRAALRDFGLPHDAADRGTLLQTLNEFLLSSHREGKTVALIIDEAQNLSETAFEELRLLSNYETYRSKLLQIILVGQPELETKLSSPALRQVNERIAVRCYINPLRRREVHEYINHRLSAAGGRIDLFSAGALRAAASHSRGIPRRINIFCHNALLFAYGAGERRVSRRVMTAAIREHAGRGVVRIPAERRSLPAFLASLRPSNGWRHSGITWATAGVLIGVLWALAVKSDPGRKLAEPYLHLEVDAPSNVPAAPDTTGHALAETVETSALDTAPA